MTTSASCSIEPDSRRSASCGRLSSRCSTARLNWLSATTGTSSSFASVFRARGRCEQREFLGARSQATGALGDFLHSVLLTGLARGSEQLQVVDDEKAEPVRA